MPHLRSTVLSLRGSGERGSTAEGLASAERPEAFRDLGALNCPARPGSACLRHPSPAQHLQLAAGAAMPAWHDRLQAAARCKPMERRCACCLQTCCCVSAAALTSRSTPFRLASILSHSPPCLAGTAGSRGGDAVAGSGAQLPHRGLSLAEPAWRAWSPAPDMPPACAALPGWCCQHHSHQIQVGQFVKLVDRRHRMVRWHRGGRPAAAQGVRGSCQESDGGYAMHLDRGRYR